MNQAVDFPRRTSLAVFAALTGLGLAANWFSVGFFYSIDFVFGSVFSMLALQLLGARLGVASALVASSITLVLWNHPYAVVVFTAEAAVVALLTARTRVGFVVADAIYWCAIGMPLVYVFYHHAMGLPAANATVTLLKDAINGIANALVARLIFIAVTRRLRRSAFPMRELLANFMFLLVLIPSLLFVVVHSRRDLGALDLHLRESLQATGQRAAIDVGERLQSRVKDIARLAGRAAGPPRPDLQREVDRLQQEEPEFLQVALVDRDATIVAHSRRADESGQPNIGRNIGDLPEVPRLKQTLMPALSEVMVSRTGEPEPVLSLLAPVVAAGGGYAGYAIGVLRLADVAVLAARDRPTGAAADATYTLLDRAGTVILSSDAKRGIMQPLTRAPGQLTPLGDGLTQWMPVARKGISVSDRWNRAVYAAEFPVAEISGWTLVVELPLQPSALAAYANTSWVLLQLGATLLIGLLVAELLGRRAAASLNGLRLTTAGLTQRLLARMKVDWDGANPDADADADAGDILEIQLLKDDIKILADALAGKIDETRQFHASLESEVAQRTEQLRQEEQRWRDFSLSSSDWFWETDAQHRFCYFSENFEEVYGLPPGKFIGMPRRELLEQDDDALDLSDVKKAHLAQLDAHLPFKNFEYRIRIGDVDRWTSISGVPHCDAQGRFTGYRGTGAIITERKATAIMLMKALEELALQGAETERLAAATAAAQEKSRQKLQDAELLMRSSLEVIDEAFVVYDAEDRLAFCNQKYLDYYPLSRPVLELGRSFEEIIRYGAYHGQFRSAVGREEAWIAERMASHGQDNREVVQQLDSGRWVKIRETHTASGHTVGFRVDITDLQEARETAESANVAKSRFLATMSHELRTPMNGILGMAQVLLGAQLTEAERRDSASTILQSGETLLALLNDVLDLSKIEAGKLELRALAFDPGQAVEETRALFAQAAASKGLRLSAGASVAAGPCYLGDRLRLRQMLSNLVNNAVKFTPQGEVRVEVREIERDGQSALLQFSVTDSGIGIAPEQQARLFQPFVQADSSTTRRFGGTGLGLSLVRELAQAMGGGVGIESAPGRGSRFWFRIRAGLVAAGTELRATEPPAAAEAAAPAPARAARGRILVVEDDATNRMVIKAMLSMQGMACDMVEDGAQAVAAITGGMVPALVLMDCQMPVLDGTAATTQIREWEAATGRPRLAIVALTASAYEEDRKRCLAVGMDDVLTKPLSIAKLAAALARWLPADDSGANAADATASRAPDLVL